MKKLIIILELYDYKYFRKIYGGQWYLISNNLPMLDFWSTKIIKSCDGIVIRYENYEKIK